MLITVISISGYAQTGVIKGKVFDNEGSPLPYAAVYTEYGDQKVGTITDETGRFTLKPLPSGTYCVHITFNGYHAAVLMDVSVASDKITFMKDVFLKEDITVLDVILVEPRVIDPGETSVKTIDRKEIDRLPSSGNIADIVLNISTEVVKDEKTDKIIMRGSRAGSSSFYVDGIRQGTLGNNLPSQAIGNIRVYSCGIPAKYGDFTGGVIVVESKSYFDYYNQWKAEQY